MSTLTDDEVRDGLSRLPEWRRDGDELVRDYQLPTFLAVIDFVQRIAAVAEEANHHPDLDIRYNRLRVALTTHDAGGLTQLDLDLAARIEQAASAWVDQSKGSP